MQVSLNLHKTNGLESQTFIITYNFLFVKLSMGHPLNNSIIINNGCLWYFLNIGGQRKEYYTKDSSFALEFSTDMQFLKLAIG